MNTKESIKNILSINGSVTIPYKSKLKDWYGKIEITKIDKGYLISGSCRYTQFTNIDTAVNYFCELSLSSKNYGYLHQRLLDKKIIDTHFEFENITKNIKDAFKTEGILADKELIDMGVYKTTFPDKKDAHKEYKQISKITDLDELKNKIQSFNDTYISIDNCIDIKEKFIYDNGTDKPYDYTVGFNFSDTTMDYINKLEREHTDLTFKCISISCKINNIYKLYDIYLNEKASE